MKKNNSKLKIANKVFKSRLIIGTGKYPNYIINRKALEASGAEMITVAMKRVNLKNSKEPKLTDYISPNKYTFIPNTAGCFNAKDALRILNLAREMGGWDMIKLEVLADKKTLYPDMVETIKTAKKLISNNFKVLAYCSDDPVLAKKLENIGCSAIMPLGSPIGSGLGIINPLNIKLIVEQSTVPVILDAGIGSASDACFAMELGCDAVLVNSAIANADDPVNMALAFKNAVIAGRKCFLSGRIEKKLYATATSPNSKIFN
ncbi:MAG: thiazole synthase [Rickettsiales bacterium]|nr:thiazole synthase [Rickettsiales bacterium]OUV83283.1 MAG: thiazole synthase [Rickettsiales bacterium TMED131]